MHISIFFLDKSESGAVILSENKNVERASVESETHAGEVFVPSSDPEGSVGGPVSEDHALGDGVAVDEALVSILLKARRVPAPLHHLDGHLRDCELVPVGHL